MLRSEQDCRVLYRLLRSPLSAWLADHITELRFSHYRPPNYPLWATLVRLCPACRNVYRYFKNDPGRISHDAALKSSLRDITSLTLFLCSFPSFRIVLRILGDITCLKTVDFRNVKWPDGRLATPDAADNVGTGSFSHIRSIEMQLCTNNTVVPAWILAAASTRHSFTRRRTVGPVVPTETWAIIELIQMFSGNGIIQYAQFDVREATLGGLDSSRRQTFVLTRYTQDTCRFIGSLSPKRFQTLGVAHLSVQVAISPPSANGDEAWSVRRIILADSAEPDDELHLHLYSRDWPAIVSVLRAFPLLQGFQVLYGGARSKDDFCALSGMIAGAVNGRAHPPVTLQHGPDMPDGRFLQPALFDLTDKELEVAREEKVRARNGNRVTPS